MHIWIQRHVPVLHFTVCPNPFCLELDNNSSYLHILQWESVLSTSHERNSTSAFLAASAPEKLSFIIIITIDGKIGYGSSFFRPFPPTGIVVCFLFKFFFLFQN